MSIRAAIAAGVLLIAWALPTNASGQVLSCRPTWRPLVRKALAFVQQERRVIWQSFLTTERLDPYEQAQADREWRSLVRAPGDAKRSPLVVACGAARSGCDAYGYFQEASRRFPPTVVICVSSHIEEDADFCGLVNTVAHEIGHAIGLPASERHEEGTVEDPVSRLGETASAMCRWKTPTDLR